MKKGKYFIILSIILILLSIGFLTSNETDNSQNTKQNSKSDTSKNISNTDYEIAEKNISNTDYEISDISIIEENYIKYISGILKNNSSNTQEIIIIYFPIYDEDGNKIEDASDVGTNIEPGSTWKFKASIRDSVLNPNSLTSLSYGEPILKTSHGKASYILNENSQTKDKKTSKIDNNKSDIDKISSNIDNNNIYNIQNNNIVENDTITLINGKDYEIVDISFDTDYSGYKPLYCCYIAIKNISEKTIPITNMTLKEHYISSYSYKNMTSTHNVYLYNFNPDEIYKCRFAACNDSSNMSENDILLESVNKLPDTIYNTEELLSGLSDVQIDDGPFIYLPDITGTFTNNSHYYAEFIVHYPTYSKSTGMRLGDAVGSIGKLRPNQSTDFTVAYWYIDFNNDYEDVLFDFDNPIVIAKTNIK
ncbi:MAG: FxLYD domain-containing protein [Peptoanaerobacter stomatis]|uniref:FxLYD domain-containing protein n=1 Tax=Peptoanaerobacter stomatis TaxID=796937 RepID=UPI003F9F857A